MAVREITKQLLGIEDINTGVGTEEQTRNGTSYTITKFTPNAVVGSIDELRQVNTAKITAALLATKAGGDFYFNTSDLSAEVAGDTAAVLFVAPNTDLTGASGAWVRVLEKHELTPSMFGGDFETDSSAAINAMFDYARNQYDANRGSFNYKCDFESKNWIIETSLNVTLIRQAGFTIKNGGLLAKCTGRIALDLAGTNAPTVADFNIWGDETDLPSIGIYYGRANINGSLDPAPGVILENVRVNGYFRKASVLNFASEVSTHNNCFFRNLSRYLNAYTYINVGNAQTLIDYLNSAVTSDYATLPVPADGSKSNILHYEQSTQYLRGSDVVLTINNITNANPPVVSVDATALLNSGLANGDSIYLHDIAGMTELNQYNYTLASVDTVAGTFELAGEDSTTYGVFSSGRVWNTTGPAVLLNGVHSTYWESMYILTYGTTPIEIDLDNGSIRDCRLSFHVEVDPIRIIEFRRNTSSVAIQGLTINLLNSSQSIRDAVFRHDGTGSVRIDSLDFKLATIPTAPTNKTFVPAANFALRGADLSLPLAAMSHAPTEFTTFTGSIFTADTDTIVYSGVSSFQADTIEADVFDITRVDFTENTTALTALGLRWNANSLYTYNSTAGAERQVRLRDSATTGQLSSLTDRVNVEDKYGGKMVWNASTGIPVYASGGADSAVWVDATGATVHTPV